MSKNLSQASDVVAKIERGDLNADFSTEMRKVILELQDQCPTKGKISGSLSLTLKLTVEGQTVAIEAVIDSKVPKRARGSSLFFIKDGELSVEHPQQMDMLETPRLAASRDRAPSPPEEYSAAG